MKICSKCKIAKEGVYFNKDKSTKDGLRCKCKECGKKYLIENKEHSDEYKKKYYQKNKEKICEYGKQYYKQNKEQVQQTHKEYYQENKEHLDIYQKKYNEQNKDRAKEYRKGWAKDNKDRVREQSKEYQKERRRTDPMFKFKSNARNLIYRAFYRKKIAKNSTTEKTIGCSFEDLKKHLEETAIKNYGTYNSDISYHIDHTVPMDTAKTEEEVLKLNHYTNLQYLTPEDNREKSNKVDWEFKQENKKEQL